MKLDKKILKFLTNHRVCSLTTLISDGSPHAAAMHFSHKDDPVELYFSTENTGRKYEKLAKNKTVKGSVVVGFSEEEWITLQMDGKVSVVSSKDLATVQKIHYSKHPEAKKYKDEPETVFLKFIPTWWRYTDFNTKTPTIISSK